MNKKLALAFILLLNHSLLFGAAQGAHLPDDDHPLGYAFHQGDHDAPHAHAGPETLPDHPGHDHPGHDHHNHGVHIHLTAGLPYSLPVILDNAVNDKIAAHQPAYGSVSYTPRFLRPTIKPAH